jgi:acyl-CoA thioesterase
MDVREFLSNDRFALMLGIEILEASNGSAKVKLEIKDEHLNAMDIVHGGTIFSLADMAFAAAVNSYGTVAVAINVNISFLKATGKGTLYAEANEISRNNKIASYTINIKNQKDELIACAQGMAYFKKNVN